MWLAGLGAAFCAALAGCGAYLKLARRFELFDVPNERSAHQTPTPKGGGIGIFLGIYAGLGLTLLLGHRWASPYPELLGISTLLLLVGLLDDRFGLPVRLRLGCYALGCGAAIVMLMGDYPLWFTLPALFYALWLLNLFNFMDGIDGIAASEAGFVLGAAGLLALANGAAPGYALFCLLPAVASVAFLYWNWAPARLFMGDAGSVPLGFLLAALSLHGEASGALPLACWLILLAVFITDASYTLCWRALNGEKITQAHSRHSYQRLARHWRSHGRVVSAMSAYNLLWLLPCATALQYWPDLAWLWLVLAYGPLLPLRWKADKLP